MQETTAARLLQLRAAITARARVRISSRNGWAAGLEGIAMGYSPGWGTVKVGFAGPDGTYAGEYTKVPLTMVDLDPA